MNMLLIFLYFSTLTSMFPLTISSMVLPTNASSFTTISRPPLARLRVKILPPLSPFLIISIMGLSAIAQITSTQETTIMRGKRKRNWTPRTSTYNSISIFPSIMSWIVFPTSASWFTTILRPPLARVSA